MIAITAALEQAVRLYRAVSIVKPRENPGRFRRVGEQGLFYIRPAPHILGERSHSADLLYYYKHPKRRAQATGRALHFDTYNHSP